jgi:hypothetical protein
MGQERGLSGLFDRVSHLGLGVLFGNLAGMLWALRNFFQYGVPLIAKYIAAHVPIWIS